MLEITGVDELTKAMLNVSAEISDKKLKRKITRKAAKPIVQAARNIAPKLEKGGVKLPGGGRGSIRYGTPKIVAKIRAPRNQGVKVAEYLRGNLAGAIRVLSLRKAISAIIGPVISKRGKGKGRYGPGTRRFDAYYAQMIYGSAKAFQRKIMIKALNQEAGTAAKSIENDLKKALKTSGRKNGLDVR